MTNAEIYERLAIDSSMTFEWAKVPNLQHPDAASNGDLWRPEPDSVWVIEGMSCTYLGNSQISVEKAQT